MNSKNVAKFQFQAHTIRQGQQISVGLYFRVTTASFIMNHTLLSQTFVGIILLFFMSIGSKANRYATPKTKYEQISVGHAMANRYGTPKNKNEQKISVGHFCGKHAMKAKKVAGLCFFVATWPQKNTDLRTCSHLSKHCTKPASEDQMCPRWAPFSN